MPSTYSDVDIDELRECITQAHDEFTRRWGQSAGTPSLVAHMGNILFAQREADLAAGKKAPSILRLRAVLDEMKRTRSLSEKSFSGKKKQQIVLADRLRKLKPFVLRDGRVLTLIGPEHPVGGEVHLYLDFAIGTPPPREQRSKVAATPADAHAARARRLADAIAQFFERLLLRRSPKEVEKLERTAKKRGLRYALIALFFPIACAGVYYYVSNQLHPYAVTFAPRHLNTRDRPRPHSLFDIPTLTVVRWNDDGPIDPPYEVYKNGRLVARTSSAYFIDEHPTRDHTPDVERLVDQYRIAGHLWGLIPRISQRTPSEDRVLPNAPCLVNGEGQLCVATYPLDALLKMPFTEFQQPPVRIAVAGEEHTLNLSPVLVEDPGTSIDPHKDGTSQTRIVTDGKIARNGDTVTYKQVFTDTGLVDMKWTDGPRPSHVVQRYTVITKEQLRNRAILNYKLDSYGDRGVYAVTVMDSPVTLADLPRTAPTPTLPIPAFAPSLLTRPQIACARMPGSDFVMIGVYPTGCKSGECEVEMDYDFLQMSLEMVPPNSYMVDKGSGRCFVIAAHDYTLHPNAEYVDYETISAWVYRIHNGERKLAQVIRKKITLERRHVGMPSALMYVPGTAVQRDTMRR